MKHSQSARAEEKKPEAMAKPLTSQGMVTFRKPAPASQAYFDPKPVKGKTTVGDTHDRSLLRSARIKALFNEDKHKITHYLKDLEAPSARSKSSHEYSINDSKKDKWSKKSNLKDDAAYAGLQGDVFQFTNKDRYKTK